jgi:hypothetical protein
MIYFLWSEDVKIGNIYRTPLHNDSCKIDIERVGHMSTLVMHTLDNHWM